MYIKAHNEVKIPTIVAIFNGNVVKETIPSMANDKRLSKFHELCPACLSCCSNSTDHILKTIQQNKPKEYLSDSLSCFRLSMHFLSNSLKSPTLGSISIFVVFCNIL